MMVDMTTTTASERTKRGNWLRFIREHYLTVEGLTFRLSGPGGGAMVGTKPDGSVWVWDEITGTVHQVAGPGSVDVDQLPEQGVRGRPKVGF
jgi:hypothetical protein